MFIWGKNNNSLIKNNHKRTFSVPQKIKINSAQIQKFVCGKDFLLILTKKHKILVYYQGATYQINQQLFGAYKDIINVIDIAICEQLMIFILSKGQVHTMIFESNKLFKGQMYPKKVQHIGNSLFPDNIQKVFIVGNHIFFKSNSHQLIHTTKNSLLSQRILEKGISLIYESRQNNFIQVCGTQNSLLFLNAQGVVYKSSKKQPCKLKKYPLKEKILHISSTKNSIYGINGVKSLVLIKQGVIENITKGNTEFIEIIAGQQNCYAITDQKQVWAWGVNSNGQLGLSDYESRKYPYPLISLERYYINAIKCEDGYTCCIVDSAKRRYATHNHSQNHQVSQFRQQWKNQSQMDQCLRPTISFKKNLQPNLNITYSQSNENDQQSYMTQKQGKTQTVIINRRPISKVVSIENKSITRSKDNKIVKSKSPVKSICKSQYCSCNNYSPTGIAKSPLKNKCFNKNTLISNSKSDRKCTTKGSGKKVKTNKIISHSKNKSKISQDISLHSDTYQQDQVKENIDSNNYEYEMLRTQYRLQKQQLQETVNSLQRQLRNKTEENADLFSLVKQRNVVIDDLTHKLTLLESAIDEHERTLTARDNQAQQAYLRQKQYQLHIVSLEAQLEKMLEVLNNQDKNKECEIYKKEMTRLSLQVKDKIQSQKQYYRQRMKVMQENFNEERNIFQLEIRNLQQQLINCRNREEGMIQRFNQHMHQRSKDSFEHQQIDSPKFKTIDMRSSFSRNGESKHLQRNRRQDTNQKRPLHQKVSFNGNVNISASKSDIQKHNANFSGKQNKEFDGILERIQKHKSLISKSANKLSHILDSEL